MEDRGARGRRLLRARVAAIPGALRRLGADGALDAPDLAGARRVLTTGLGSSAGVARYLAWLLSRELGVPSAYLPLGALAEGLPPRSEQDALVLFSQGLSPNARFALRDAALWGRVVLVTAAREREAPEVFALLAGAGADVLSLPLEHEGETLVRVLGPMASYAAALALARATGRSLGLGEERLSLEVERVCARVEAARATVEAAFPPGEPLPFDRPTALLVSGGYGEGVGNLGTRILEGMLRPLPPTWDLLEFAHGGFQGLHACAALLLALARSDAPGEKDLLSRLEGMLEPARHRLCVLSSPLPAPLAVFEHEACLDELMLRWMEERRLDPLAWPGKGSDAPLYALAPALSSSAIGASPERAKNRK